MAKNIAQKTSVGKHMEPMEFLYIADGYITCCNHFGKLAVFTKDKQMHTI